MMHLVELQKRVIHINASLQSRFMFPRIKHIPTEMRKLFLGGFYRNNDIKLWCKIIIGDNTMIGGGGSKIDIEGTVMRLDQA